jgi:CRISPR-associated endoribonuclease Cas6
MRILVRLDPAEEYPMEGDHHYHLQGWLYSLMREAERTEVHDRMGYRYFCFSNLFPYSPKMVPGREVNLLVSSPDLELAQGLSTALTARIRAGGETTVMKIGQLKFLLRSFEGPFFLPELRSLEPLKLRSSTPIIIRIPERRYADYGIRSERPYTFWRDTIALEAFVKQLRDNMEKKLIHYRDPERGVGYPAAPVPFEEKRIVTPLPEVVSYRFMRTVSKPITVKGETQLVIGSIWELEFAPQTEVEASNLEFAVESGFGERNSLGFGFMNLAR